MAKGIGGAGVRLAEIQAALREEGLDGWLFFDHHRRDPLAYRVLEFSPGSMVTRRWYYFVPANGDPRGLQHRIEAETLKDLPGAHEFYSGWQDMAGGLRAMLGGAKRVAMQYSPDCAVPYVAMVDAGTVELVQGMGVEVASSASLIQFFESRWSERQLGAHLEAGRRVDRIRGEAFRKISECVRAGGRVTEWELQQFILMRFREEGLLTDHGPDVAVNANASNPHYEPKKEASAEIRKGDLVLLDMWAKLDQPEGVYYDITWVAYCGDRPPETTGKIFRIVKEARDQAVARVKEAVAAGRMLRGYEVDDAARAYIRDAGYGECFFHRTGHSIGVEVHGTGANMDNLETHDERKIIPWTCFSIEPGIYLPEFGIRSEVDVFVDERQARITGEVQHDIVLL
jgi:Xaa-Pro dipeptidase